MRRRETLAKEKKDAVLLHTASLGCRDCVHADIRIHFLSHHLVGSVQPGYHRNHCGVPKEAVLSRGGFKMETHVQL